MLEHTSHGLSHVCGHCHDRVCNSTDTGYAEFLSDSDPPAHLISSDSETVSSDIRKLSDGVEVELVDSNVFDKLMLLSKSKHARDIRIDLSSGWLGGGCGLKAGHWEGHGATL